ncbi:MAG: hypothetical protein ACOC53_05005 [Candidatus Saliniplasma sp.]
MEGIEEEINNIKSVLRYYIGTAEKMRRIDVPLVDNQNDIETALHALHHEVLDISRTVILLNDIMKQRSSGIFIRTLIEVVNVMGYIDQNPSELDNYENIQTEGFELIEQVDFSRYFKTPFNRSYLTELFRDSYIRNSYQIYPISRYEISYDLETTLRELKITLHLLHLSTKIYRRHVEKYLLPVTKEKLEVCRFETIRIFKPKEFEGHLDEVIQDYYKNDELPINEKEKLIKNIELIKRENPIEKKDLSDIEAPTLLFRNINYIERDKELNELVNLYFSLKETVEASFTGLEDDGSLEIFAAFMYDSFRLIETIIYLNTLKKYIESNIVHATILENRLLVEYFHQFPEEVKRWKTTQDILETSLLAGKRSKEYFSKKPSTRDGFLRNYRQMDYTEFCNYIDDKGFENLKERINEENFEDAKFFKLKFIRMSLKRAGLETEDKLYSELSKYVHPNIYIAKKPKLVRDVDEEVQTLKKCLNHFSKHLDIIISRYGHHIPYINRLENRVEEIKELS